MGGFLVQAALRCSLKGLQHVSPVPPSRAGDLAASVYRQVEHDFNLLTPPVALHSSAPPVMAACWLMLRGSLIVSGRVDRDTKEAVATVVSLCNDCPYCVDVHSMTLEALGAKVPEDPENDHAVRHVADWARNCAHATTAARRVPFPLAHVPELVGVVLAFHYINRMVNIFLPDSPLCGVPQAVRARMLRMLGRSMHTAARAHHSQGASLDLLPAAPVPDDLAWARDNPIVAQAFASAAAVIDAAGARSAPAAVRALLDRILADWTGSPPDSVLITKAVNGLPLPDRVAGRIAVQTAFASSQMDFSTIAEFRRAQPDDQSLIELTSWASMSAARRIGSWITADLRKHYPSLE